MTEPGDNERWQHIAEEDAREAFRKAQERPALRGGRPIPDDYPLDPEDLHGDVEAVPAEKLQALVDYYGDDDPPGEPVPDDVETV